MSLLHVSNTERPGGRGPTTARSKLRRCLVAIVTVSTLVTTLAVTGTSVAAAAPLTTGHPYNSGQPDFGPNVKIFDPSMPTSQIQATVDAIAAEQINDEMGTQRYSLLFKPGSYGTADAPLKFQVGYYTEVAGLGQNPTDVTINGSVDVYNRCRPIKGCFALDNFWRSISNLTVNFVAKKDDGCRAAGMFWAASQASPMRRVNITGGTLTLMDFCTDGPQYASGGFIADSKTGSVINGSQQQYLVRDSTIGQWSNGVWNQVFAGVNGAPAECFPAVTDVCGPYTTLAKNPASREKPYLYIDSAGKWKVFVPSPRTNYSGTTWENGPTLGRAIPLSKFFIAKPSDSVKTINKELSQGKNLLFTPGVYDVDKTIKITNANTVVLGMGIATLTAVNGAVVMSVADVKGVDIGGITIDAGTKNSPVLLQIGTKNGHHGKSSAANPTALQDVFFRIGGPHVGKATVSLEVNSDNVILDNIWAWRADHGNPGAFGWDVSTGRNGVVVNGDNVTATGFFVEHYQQHNVIWNGNGGKVIFFQNEMPYDPPSQQAWRPAPAVGWAALKVADKVTRFNGYGMGSYSFFNQGVDIFADNAYEVPPTLPPGSLHNMLTIFLDPATGKGGINNVVNGIGGPSTIAKPGIPVTVVDYPLMPDNTPPTVAITDNVAGATATGDITFTFTFSEDVGATFTTDDVVLTGGTKGTFTRVDGKKATLVVAPTANSTGTIGISVAAGTFIDLAGNANTASGTATQAYDTTIAKTQMALPVTFDSATVDYGLIGFGGAENSTLTADPTNAANTVAKVVRAAAAETYAGTTITAAAGLGFASRIPFTANDTSMSVRVWSPDANIPVRLKVEDHSDNTKTVETETTTTVAGGWETLTFNFANQANGTASLNLASNYDKASIFFDFGRAKDSVAEKTYYFDDVTFVPGTPPPPAAGVITFDESTPPVLTGFGGAEDATIVADPANAANKVAKVVKGNPVSEVWAGTTVSNLPNQSIAPIGFSATKTKLTAKVWSPDAGIPVRLKVENAANGAQSVETEATMTVAGGWETLTFDFASPVAGTPALSLATTYNKVSIFFDFGTAGSGKTYYLDDLDFTFAGQVTPPPAPWAVTFDDSARTYTLTDFGLYGTVGAVVADPAGGVNKVVQVFKYAVGSEQWGGTTVSTEANFSVPTIPFTAAQTKMTLRVYSPAAGVRVRMKVENAGNTGINCETDAFTTTSGAWETLTFDFGDPSTHYIPNGETTYDLTKPTAPLNVANTYNKVSVFFDFGRGNGGYAPMSADRTYFFDDLGFIA